MKVCRKCKNEYKDNYAFCPKCGTPYDINKKPVKTPTSIISKSLNPIASIWNILLYVFGGLLIIAYLTSFNESVADSIFGILFGLSLFQIFYKLISDKASSVEVDKILKIARIVLPIIILMVWAIVVPDKNNDDYKKNDANAKQEEIINVNETEEVNDDEDQESRLTEEAQKSNSTEEVKKPEYISYTLKYNKPGDYGKLVEYEGEKDYFYYYPNGNYEIELTRMSGTVCFLWLDYNKGYKSKYGTSYNNKEKLTFTHKGERKSLIISSDVHIYNSNDCDYELTKQN